MRRKKLKKLFIEIIDERLQDYKFWDIKPKVLQAEEDIKKLKKDTFDALTATNVIWQSHVFDAYRSKK